MISRFDFIAVDMLGWIFFNEHMFIIRIIVFIEFFSLQLN